MNETVHGPTAVSTNDLLTALSACLAQFFGEPCRIQSIDRQACAYRSSYALEVLDVCVAGGPPMTVMFKDLGRAGISDEARRAKPDFLYDPLREIEVYRHILAHQSLGTPICYGTVADAASQRYWLFLEQVAATELYMVGELETWQRAARWLARLHSSGVATLAALEPGVRTRLVQHDEDYYRCWLDRAARFAGGQDVQWLARSSDVLVKRLAALSPTLIHGEFYASNILVQTASGSSRVCPVDWELAGSGPGLVDLAALVAGNWTEAARSALARAYYDELCTLEQAGSGFDSLLCDLAWCRLYLAIQWLGWSPDWSPPEAHAHDWRSEAIRLATQLGLA